MSDTLKQFLMDFKQAATTSSGIDLVPRSGNMQTLGFLGITKKNLEEILLGLSVADYCKGPIPDRDKPGDLWEFGKEMDGYEVYIKLKAVKEIKLAKCLSFHIAKYPMKYPMKYPYKPEAQD